MFRAYDQFAPSIIVGTGGELAELTALECGRKKRKAEKQPGKLMRSVSVMCRCQGVDESDSQRSALFLGTEKDANNTVALTLGWVGLLFFVFLLQMG